jgi:hypothetical protein
MGEQEWGVVDEHRYQYIELSPPNVMLSLGL